MIAIPQKESPSFSNNGLGFQNSSSDDYNRFNSVRKPYPPFGKRLALAAENGCRPHNDIMLFMGIYAWEKAKDFSRHHWSTLLPLNDEPNKYCWNFVSDLPVLIMVTTQVDYQLLCRLGYELLEANATIARALLIYLTKPELIIFWHEV